jgi:hypothetical protein
MRGEKIQKGPDRFGDFLSPIRINGLVKSPQKRHPGESRSPEFLERTGLRFSPE